jgi:hypothetical protein
VRESVEDDAHGPVVEVGPCEVIQLPGRVGNERLVVQVPRQSGERPDSEAVRRNEGLQQSTWSNHSRAEGRGRVRERPAVK